MSALLQQSDFPGGTGHVSQNNIIAMSLIKSNDDFRLGKPSMQDSTLESINFQSFKIACGTTIWNYIIYIQIIMNLSILSDKWGDIFS